MQGLSYLLLRIFLGLLSSLSFKGLYKLAFFISPICYWLIPKYRKRALSNLKLAKELNLDDASIMKIAKQSLAHLLLTAFEYGKLHTLQSLKGLVKGVNQETAHQLLDENKGVIFFCGHQSNWELLFLDATTYHKGTCIGKPIKNKRLYQFILAIREKFGGQVVLPKEAYKACMKTLKRGELVGIVGDQGMPDSPFSYLSMGRKASITTLPALLALRSGCPLIVASIVRGYGSYTITYSDPIYPEADDPHPIETLTLKAALILDEKIKAHKEQWMWQHNRWKIAYNPIIPKKYRQDAIALVVPNDPSFIVTMPELQALYPGAYWIVFIPQDSPSSLDKVIVDELYRYKDLSDCFIHHFGPKLLIDGVGIKGIKKHFAKQSLFAYLEISSPLTLIQTWNEAHAR